MPLTPSAQYSVTLRVEIVDRPGMLGRVASAIGEAGGTIGAVDLIAIEDDRAVRDITVAGGDQEHWRTITAAVDAIDGVRVIDTTDRTLLLHVGGKIEMRNKHPLKTREAVLGLGDIGPRAAMPVMEGKAMLFKEFGGVDAFPICLDTRDPGEIVRTVTAIAPAFGGINLEDISAPRCFEVEERLKVALDIPVFHDDQHGTAVVVLAALLNACRLTGRDPHSLRVVIVGLGAAGIAVTKILLAAGVTQIVGADSRGALHTARADYLDGSIPPMKRWFAEVTTADRRDGGPAQLLEGADLLIGVSGARVVPADALAAMSSDAMVFAMANPNPEVTPEEAAPHVHIMATGRSDYPNQINNVLCFPGIFRGTLDVRAPAITEAMKTAAAHAIADVIPDSELREDYIIPSVFNRDVADAVAAAVADTARRDGLAEAGDEVGYADTETHRVRAVT
ncbi:MAG: NAD-dependent malic enzyme [Actinobacteria bacterium]|nr:MAG: NAD-dependent malic enzyme [Actinomycetota bacterium]